MGEVTVGRGALRAGDRLHQRNGQLWWRPYNPARPDPDPTEPIDEAHGWLLLGHLPAEGKQ